MSTIKVDTVQSTGGGAVTLTNQVAIKHSFTFDQFGGSGYSDVSGATIRDSFNNSSITDVSEGIGEPSFMDIDNIQDLLLLVNLVLVDLPMEHNIQMAVLKMAICLVIRQET